MAGRPPPRATGPPRVPGPPRAQGQPRSGPPRPQALPPGGPGPRGARAGPPVRSGPPPSHPAGMGPTSTRPSGPRPQPASVTGAMARMQLAPSQGGNNGNGNGASQATGSNGSSAITVPMGRGMSRGLTRRVDRTLLDTRPKSAQNKKGAEGHMVPLVTNHFRLNIKDKDWVLRQYDVNFSPEEDRTGVRKALLYQFADSGTLPRFIFDGKMLVTPYLLSKEQMTLVTSLKESASEPITISITLIKELTKLDSGFLQFFNILVRNCLSGLDLELIGRNFFDPKGSITIPEFRLELWPGYVTSIRHHESNILMCAEVSHKILRMDTVLDVLKKCFAEKRDRFQDEAKRLLLGTIIITRYNNKTYRIDDIRFDMKPQNTFETKKGVVSFVQYYKDRYKIDIRDPQQPLLESLPKQSDIRRGFDKPSILVPELCHLTGLSDDQRSNFNLMSAVGNYTRTAPPQRVEGLLKLSQRFRNSPKVVEEFKKWDLSIEPNLETISNARTLPPEMILQGGGRTCSYQVHNADWGGALRSFKMYSCLPCQRWICLYPEQEQQVVTRFIDLLTKSANGMGFQLAKPKPMTMPNNRPSTYSSAVEEAVKQGPSMVMVVIPNNRSEAYKIIKKICCVRHPVPSQVMTGTILRKEKAIASVASKVALQMASKLGNAPWAIKIPIPDAMICGFDVFHDTTKKGLAVGAFVSTFDATFTRYHSSVTFHHNDEELTPELGGCLSKALQAYGNANKKLPDKIFIYRDGVGDGQIEHVKQEEIQVLRRVFKQFRQDYNPKLCFVIVSKRVNAKFFSKAGGQFQNPPSGTVIDDVVTLPERYDFFLVSQSVRQGTVNPTSFNVIEDDIALKPDHLQKLTYKLSHMYYNWTGTVRVPCVCQYAHKLASLVGQNIHEKPSEALSSLLYYL